MKHTSMNIPLEVSSFVIQNKLYKPFATYLHLKFYNDKIKGSELPIRGDKRTFHRHLTTLVELNWIGYNPASDVYHIRGFESIRIQHGFKSRRATKLYNEDLKTIQTFLAGSLICYAVRNQQYYRRTGTVVKKRGTTNQLPFFPYNSLPVDKIAKILYCKMTRASVLKNKAAQQCYISTKKHFQLLSDNINYRTVMVSINPVLGARLKLFNGKVYRQLPDEILPNMQFKKLNKLHAKK